jgi:hypothetical protein
MNTIAIGIAAFVLIVLLAAFVYTNYFGSQKTSVPAGSEAPYRPLPPKGISVVSGNVIWHYDNSTASIIITGFSQNDIIGVTEGQEISMGMSQPAWMRYESNTSVLYQLRQNQPYEVTQTGNASIVNKTLTSPLT